MPSNDTSSGGFLSGFVEASVEMPADGLNGDCIIHYSGQYSNYTMRVELLNGIREGDAVIMKGDIPYMILMYMNGVLNGNVERLNQFGTTDLKGQLVNGVETGLFVELNDNRKVVWRGYYRNGVRYSELTKSDTLDGYYDERSVSSKALLTTAQYDDSLHNKHGRCFEYENGKLERLCLYEYGDVIQTVQEWELYDMILSKRIDPMVLNFLNSSLFTTDITSGESVGCFQLNREYFCIDLSVDTIQVVVVDLDSKEMIVHINQERSNMQNTIEVIDLDADGRRWEGGVKNEMPYGYGVLYDEEGKKEYEGFLLDGMKICYGIEYYSDIERVKYEGCFCSNKRFGRGILYDRNGEVEYDGTWIIDTPYSSSFDGKTIDSRTESITAPRNSFNELKSFILCSFIHSLKRMVIGDGCFGSVRLFELDGLIELESVVIGEISFKTARVDDISMSGRIVNCLKLKSIQIGYHSFSDYHSFELLNLPQLQSVKLGTRAFYRAHSVVFESD